MKYLDYLNESITPYHTVENTAKMLLEQGFQELSFQSKWSLEPSESYFIKWGYTTLFAFRTPKQVNSSIFAKLALAHTDFPALKVAPNACRFESGIQLVHSEVYGSPIYHSWLDRDLGCGGVLVFEKDNQIQHRLVQTSQKFRIPELSIHLQRGVNQDGRKVDAQKGLDVFWSSSEKDSLDSWIKQQLSPEEKLLDYDLRFYDAERASLGGMNDEWIYSGRIDNLASCHAAIEALLSANSAPNYISGFCLFNHEEIGSETKEGAQSLFLKMTLDQIIKAINISEYCTPSFLEKSFFVSMDMAHALNPVYPEKHDPKHAPILGQGIVLKQNAQKRYATDVFSSAVFKQICSKAGVSYQNFISRNDLPCGSTIGPSISSTLGVSTVDIGEPMLSMHSIREMSSVQDHQQMIKFLASLFKDY